jgi:hypothetical protein
MIDILYILFPLSLILNLILIVCINNMNLEIKNKTNKYKETLKNLSKELAQLSKEK